jgi:hypothetical protein
VRYNPLEKFNVRIKTDHLRRTRRWDQPQFVIGSSKAPPTDLVFIQRLSKYSQCVRAVLAFDHELRNHWVVVNAHFVALFKAGFQSYSRRLLGDAKVEERTDVRQEITK